MVELSRRAAKKTRALVRKDENATRPGPDGQNPFRLGSRLILGQCTEDIAVGSSGVVQAYAAPFGTDKGDEEASAADRQYTCYSRWSNFNEGDWCIITRLGGTGLEILPIDSDARDSDFPAGVSCNDGNCTQAEPILGGTVCCDEHEIRTAKIPLPFTPLDEFDAAIDLFTFEHVSGDVWQTAEFFRACSGGNGTYRLDRTLYRDGNQRRQSRVELITVDPGGCDQVCAVYESCCFVRCPCEQEHKLVDWQGGEFPGDFAGRICLKPDRADDDPITEACAADSPSPICGGATVQMPVAWEVDLAGFDGVNCSAGLLGNGSNSVWKYRGTADEGGFCEPTGEPSTNVDVNGTHLCVQGEGVPGSPTWGDFCHVGAFLPYHAWIPAINRGASRPAKISMAVECGRICVTVHSSTFAFRADAIKIVANYSVEIDTTGMTPDEIACWINQEHTLTGGDITISDDDDPCWNCRTTPAVYPGAADFTSPPSITIRPLGAGGTGPCDPPPIAESDWCEDGPPATSGGACPDDECYGSYGGDGGGGSCDGECVLEWHQGEGWEAVDSTCIGTGDCAGGQHCACQSPGRDGEFNNEVIFVACGCCTTESSGVCTD